jgi:hypothetical protein
MPLSKAIEAVARRKGAKKSVDEGVEFNPKKHKVLPEPPSITPSSRRVTFSKPSEEIRLVGKALLDDDNAKPGDVGEKAFDLALARARKRSA